MNTTPETNPGSYLNQGNFASMPLADAQRMAAEAARQQQNPNMQQQVVASPAAPPVVVDMDLDQLEETEFSPYRFRLHGSLYTLRLQDDHLLSEISEQSVINERSLDDLLEKFFTETFESAADRDGNMIPPQEGLNQLLDDLFGIDEAGNHVTSFKKKSQLVKDAVIRWSGELSDPSMRPQTPNRAARRQRGR